MIAYICIIALAIIVIFLGITVSKQREKIRLLSDSMKIVDDLFGRHEDAMAEFDHRLTELRKKLEKAEELIDAHAELEKEAAKSEQLFQEGLTNLLSYGVSKNE